MSGEVILLGPVALTNPAEELGGPKASAVFALLALSVGSVVSTNKLVDGVWEDLPPDSVSATLQAYISRLRKICRTRGHDIARTGSGYRLDMPRAYIDAHHLADEITAAERTVSPDARAFLLEAIAPLLGDEPLGGCPSTAALDMARHQLEALQLTAVQLFATTALSVELEVPSTITRIADRNPTAEAAQAALCTLLWNRGRTAEARQRLAWVIDHSRSTLGKEPSGAMLRLDAQLSAGGLLTGPTRAETASARPDARPAQSSSRNPSTTKLAGRTSEQRALQSAISGNRPAVVVVTGEGGIGKSTLVRASLPRAQWAPAPVIGATPWPWIWDLFGIDPPSTAADASLYEVLDTSTRSICDGLRNQPKPRTLVVDDLHNRSTVARLQFAALARSLDGTSLSLVGISRDELLELGPETSGGTPTTRIQLAPLSDADALSLVQAQVPTNDPRVVQLLADAGGSPLLLSRGIQRLADDLPGSLANDDQSGRVHELEQRVLGLIALAGTIERATLVLVIGPEAADALDTITADGQLTADPPFVSFSHDRLAEAALSHTPTAAEVADRHRLARLLLDRWDGDAQSAVALSEILFVAEIAAVEVHLAAAGAHQLARDWQAAATATEHAANDSGGADKIVQLAAERWIRAGDLWRARELLAPGVEHVVEQLAATHNTTPEATTDLGPLVEYISYGTTGFRIDDRVRQILAHRPRDSADEARSLMLEAVELTEIRRGSIRAVPQSDSSTELLARARKLGNQRAISWALGPTLVDALNKDDHQQLSVLADELAANAAGPEQAEVPVVAGWYRFEAALRRGDNADANHHLADIERRARTTMEVPSRWYANTLRAGRLIGEGRFDDAESCLRLALELGSISIGSEAYASYGAGLLMIRWFQDRSTELLAAAPPRLADSPVGAPSMGIVFGALIRSLVPSSADRRELAAVVPRASNSLEHALVAEAALATNDQAAARAILAVFRPTSPMVVMPAGLYVAAAESVRGRLLALIGEPGAAAPVLARGAAIERSAGAILATNRTALAQAAALVDAGASAEGNEKAAEVEHWSRSHGVHALERQAVELRAKSSLA